MPDVDEEESKGHALKMILIERHQSLVRLERESFFTSSGNVDILRAKG